MKVKNPIADKLLHRLGATPGTVFSVSDLLDLGPRTAVDQALSRLTEDQKVRRLGRGLYTVPDISELLKRPVNPSPAQVVRAWARKNGLRLIPSGAYAANLLGLSTQVPAKTIYYTNANGYPQQVKLGPYIVKLLKRGPKTMDVQGELSQLLFVALRYMGKEWITPDLISMLRSKLRQKDKVELKRNLHLASAWMRPILKQLAEGKKR